MKLPFNGILTPILKPNLKCFNEFCQYPTFCISLPYTYFYGTFINVCHLKRHFGKNLENAQDSNVQSNTLVVHDLKIIAASMGIVQHTCLLVGCFTENPALFLPHMFAHLLMVVAKTLNALIILTRMNLKSVIQLRTLSTAIAFMMFNWCQEFCVFIQYLCFCDL
ncbi:PREDICTED: uncharacterized protein LOC106118881 [Papilio xuthus]|uniref:Uncharacterized protein LOC106118881 n=1 Tax=Papilio xuthus TaxID=66420 RepID=A0AAJ7EA96_PAPXU|nr:PREDICTED: uncharacterized protein LOC106118881 [Papilio xuthus]